MPQVCFLIPASPTAGFFSQIAAFRSALTRLEWKRWEPSVVACLGGDDTANAYQEWRPHLRDITLIFISPEEVAQTPHYYAQIDGLFRYAPLDADLYVRLDADVLPVTPFEDLLDYVASKNVIAGVMAHFSFPVQPNRSASRSDWEAIAAGLITTPLEFRYSYSLADASVPDGHREAPFYLNDGTVFFPRTVFHEYAARYLSLRPKLMNLLAYPYFSGQVALALAVTEMKARTCALPMRYSFPNDEKAARKYPEELAGAVIFHYLRTDGFDRQLMFTSQERYQQFLDAPLTGANKLFQDRVRQLLGPELPWKGSHADHS